MVVLFVYEVCAIRIFFAESLEKMRSDFNELLNTSNHWWGMAKGLMGEPLAPLNFNEAAMKVNS